MRERLRTGYAFVVKDVTQARRESQAWVTFAIAAVAMLTFAALTSGPRRMLVGLQLVYLAPAVVVGTFFTRCIDTEVRVLAVLRMILRSTRLFLEAKLLVITLLSLALVWPTVVVTSAWILRSDGVPAVGARLAITLVGTILQSGVCLGLAACFTRVDEPETSRNAAAPLWVHGGYWLSALPIASLLWVLDALLVEPAARHHTLGAWPLALLASAAIVLTASLVATVVLLLAVGAKRLATVD